MEKDRENRNLGGARLIEHESKRIQGLEGNLSELSYSIGSFCTFIAGG